MRPTLIALPFTIATIAFAAPSEAARADAQAPDTLLASGADRGAQATEAKALKRLIRFEDGRVVRGVARQSDAGWEIRGKGGWQTLPNDAIVSVRLEKELLAEARRLRKGYDSKDLGARARLAGWMIQQGLYAEAVAELDRVLTFEPDQPDALIVLQRTPPPITLPREGSEPATRAALVRFGAKAGPVGREVTIAALADLGDALALRETLRQELVVGQDRRRAFATHALRRLYPGDQVRELIGRAVLDSSADVRRGAALALRAADDPAAAATVVKGLGSKSQTVRTHAASALGDMGYPGAVEPLMMHLFAVSAAAQSGSGNRVPHSHIFVGKQQAYVQDFDVEVAQFQAVADPQINVLITGDVLDAGVHSVREVSYTHERKVTRGALRQLTGADPGDRTTDWRRWWEDNASRWQREAAGKPTGPVTRAGD